jgi:hypothetical protein
MDKMTKASLDAVEEASEMELLLTQKLGSLGQKDMVEWVQIYVKRMHYRSIIAESYLQPQKKIVCEGKPNWANLVAWLKLYHEHKIHGYVLPEDEEDPGHPDVWHIFRIIKDHRAANRSWEVAKTSLPGLRGMLAKEDEMWLNGEESDVEDDAEDVTEIY